MKVALVSDVHGNLEALKAVFDDIGQRGVDHVYSLGDVVGYGPEPQECLDLLRERAGVHLVGNHDAALVSKTPVTAFNENARKAVEWTEKVMREESFRFIAGLPYKESREDICMVHSSPHEPAAWHYIVSLSGARECFSRFTERVCCVGHTHTPFIVVYREGSGITESESDAADFEKGCRYLVNVGSVGQPRDLDPRASYAVIDITAGTVKIFRVAYEVERTQDLMRQRGLPDFLIERLAVGR